MTRATGLERGRGIRRGLTASCALVLVAATACGTADAPAGDEPFIGSTDVPSTGAPSTTEPGAVPPPPVPAADLPEVLAAAALHRVTVDNSFGGGSPFDRVQVIERLGVVDANGFLDARDGRELDELERDAIVAALEPLPVEFVAADVLAETDALDDAPVGRAVLTLAEPAELEGRLTITSQLWCGGLCGIGGANEIVRSPDGAWSIGDPVGMQWIS